MSENEEKQKKLKILGRSISIVLSTAFNNVIILLPRTQRTKEIGVVVHKTDSSQKKKRK